jgi:hypothetical protein
MKTATNRLPADNRCRCIVKQVSVVEVKAGDLVRQLPEAIDLCENCSSPFADWLKSCDHTNHARPGEAFDAAPLRDLVGAITR